MTLDRLLAGIDVVRCPDGNPDIGRIAYHPALLSSRTLFVACRYPWLTDRSALHAAGRGAAAIMLDEVDEQPSTPWPCPTIVVRQINQAYATACANFFGNAHRELRFYGVTGTKGKTTTCHLLESILETAGVRVGLVSTLVQRIGPRELVSHQTTPDPYRLHRTLSKMRAAGLTHVVLEASSIGLAEDRLHGIQFAGVVFTNLGLDHLEYHGGLSAYKAAKRRLFTDRALRHPTRSCSVINLDDAFGRELADVALGPVVTYGLHDGDVRATDIGATSTGLRATIDGVRLDSHLLGAYNVYNIVAAVALARREVRQEAIVTGVHRLDGLPGRFERVAVPAIAAPDVFVDYAHTPESVDAVLQAAALVAGSRRRVVLVGCGGNSDRGKRAPIAQAAVARSELCIITSDNPRSEDPHEIIKDMVSELPVEDLRKSGRIEIIVDRGEGIYRAVQAASTDGLVMLLGRGSEKTQIVGSREVPFDDREVARDALLSLYGRPSRRK